MNPVDRLAAACLTVTARRWPGELSEAMSLEWSAELAALRTDPSLGVLARAWRTAAFAASLACSPAVEAAGAPARTWRDRLAGAGRAVAGLAGAAGVALLAAALFDVVHAVDHGLGPHLPAGVGVAAGVCLLAAAVGVMARIGALAGRRTPARHAALRTVPVGLALYMFLLAGNRVAVMPFMGWRDIAPAVAAWTVLTAAAIGLARRAVAGGRWHAVAGVVGGGLALVAATACGSLHAAGALGIGVGSSPAWFGLALLPGGAATVGGSPAGGTVAGTGWHASEILLANASAMAGPMLLCSAFVLAAALCAAPAAVPGMVTARPALGALTVPGGIAARPALVAVAVFGAATVPTAAAHSTLVHTLIAVPGWLVAVTAALASRDRPACRPVAAALVAAPLAVLLLVPTSGGAASPGDRTTLLIHAALAVTALAVVRFDGSARRLRQVGRWLMLGAGAAVLTLPIAEALGGPGGTVVPALARIGDNTSVFGFGFLATAAGQLTLGVVLSVLAARWVVAPQGAPGTAGSAAGVAGAHCDMGSDAATI